MAGKVEAQHLLLLGQPLALVPLGQFGQVGEPASRLVVLGTAEQAHLAAAAVGGGRAAGLHRPIEHRDQLRPAAAERVEGPGLDQDSMAARLTAPGSSRSQKSNRLRKGPPAARSRQWRRRPRRRIP